LSGPYRVVPWPAPGQKIPDCGRHEVMAVSADDRAGRVYVFQRSPTYPMLVFDHDGQYLSSWGRGRFTEPHGCRVAPDGSVWLTDNGDHRVLRFTGDGRLLRSWGVRGVAGNDARHFNRPADVAFGPAGDIYIADGYGNARVVRLAADGSFVQAWGRHGTGPSEFHLVHTIAVDGAGLVYVGDRENRRIQIFTSDGRFLREWTAVGYPFGLAFLPGQRRLVVADGVADTLSIYDLAGRRLARWGGTGSAPGKMRRAHLCATDAAGAIYVAEVKNHRVQKFVPA
jgi:peptidylamidoglycolate lyase